MEENFESAELASNDGEWSIYPIYTVMIINNGHQCPFSFSTKTDLNALVKNKTP